MLAIIITLSVIGALTGVAAILITIRTNRAITEAERLIRDERSDRLNDLDQL